MSIKEIYAKEIAEAVKHKNDLPSENYKIWIDNIIRNQRKRELQRAKSREKKSPVKKIPQGKVHWLESELAKV